MPFVTKLKKRYIQFTRKKQKRVILKDNMKRNNCNEIPRASLPLFSLFLSKRGVKENGHETQFCCKNVSLELEVIFFLLLHTWQSRKDCLVHFCVEYQRIFQE